ncbi:MAG: family 1 glycosylhydrolase [Actinobacteria bacterium]|nr:family 1 glycosylhydrolase [Actinomycetota bacterium]
MQRADFGDDFTWGVASASFQIEGAPTADGKKPSIWDEMVRLGRVAGEGGDQGIQFHDRYEDDLALIHELGFDANRISLSWPRLMGNGRDPWNPKGADFYDRVIDRMLELGLEPWVTVHHWDLPLALWNQGAWTRRGIVEDFAAFAERCAEAFGDRVKHWMVFNEPFSVIGSIVAGLHERRGPHPSKALRSAHHMNLACAEAGRRMRAVLGDAAQIGTTNVMSVVHPYEPTDERTARRKRALEALMVDIFLDPAGGLGYPFEATKLLAPLKRHIEDGDLEAATFRYDFMGVQYYGPLVGLRQLPVLGPTPLLSVPDGEVRIRSEVGVPLDPEGLLWTLRKYARHPAADRLVITEGGFGCQDRLVDGRIRDDIRIWSYRRHLEVVAEARAEGIPVDGYFAWSYADNIEWYLGRRPRFGLVYVDYEDDYRRIPKDSARWFQALLTEGADV